MGNVTMDQRNVSPTTSNPWVSRDQQFNGDWITTAGNGVQATSFLRNEGPASRVISSRVSQSSVQEASRAADAARSEAVTASNDLSSTLVDTMSRGSSKFRSTGRTDGQSVSASSELGASADRVRAISDSVARTTGLDARQVANIAFQLSGGVGTPGISPVKASATGGVSKSYSGTLTEAEQKVANELSSEQLREFKSFAERATRDQSFVRSLGSDEREGSDLASRMSTAVTRAESTQSTYAERSSVAERLSKSYETGEVLSIDLAQLPANSDFINRYQRLAADYGSDSLALQAAMASELASRALPPTRTVSGAALPTSFGDIRSLNQQTNSDPAFSKDRVVSADSSNDRAAAGRISTRGLTPPETPPALGAVRTDVTGQVTSALSQPTQASTFDERNQIVRNPDGSVTTRKSQLVGNVRQIREDAAALAENAKEVLSDGSDAALKRAEEGRARLESSERSQAIRATPEVPTMTPRGGRRR
jgi:conjugal transfer mating pair stabilization protein TraG